MTHPKKVLLVTFKGNENDAALRDLRVVGEGFQRAGADVRVATSKELYGELETLDIEGFDLIVFVHYAVSLHISTTVNYAVAKAIYERAQDGALAMLYCDVTFKLDTKIWDPAAEGGWRASKLDYLSGRPIKIIASFSDGLIEDPKAMEYVNRKIISRAHPDTSFHTIQWLTLHYGAKRLDDAANVENYSSPTKLAPINKFYYGHKKPLVAKSLKAMGIGNHPDDAIFGGIGKFLPNVKNMWEKGARDEVHWGPYAKTAESVMLPYEPIKGDYQVTLRFMEALEVYPDTVEFDDRVAEWMRPFASSATPWLEAQEKVVEDFRALLG